MLSLCSSVRIAATAALCAISLLAEAQFETRSTTALTHPSCRISAADFRNDGKQDLAVALDSQSIAIALGNGDGTFQKPTVYQAGSYVDWLATGPLTSSGNADIVVADGNANALSIFLGNGDGTFQAPTLIRTPQDPGFVIIGDFNGDHIPDLAVADSSFISPYITILPGNGDGTFGTPINIKPPYVAYAFAAGDFDHNGTLDLAVNAYKDATSYLEILLGKGNGTFTQGEEFTFDAPVGIPAVADFRGNGEFDIAVPEGGAVQVLLGNGNGTFATPVTYSSAPLSANTVVLADFNGDGKQDIAVIGEIPGNLKPGGFSLLLGNGDGTFQPPVFVPVTEGACYAAVADFNADGMLDLAVTDDGTFPQAITVLNTGTVAFSPTTPVAFPDQFVGTTSAPQSVLLTNNGTTPLSVSSITATAPYSVSSSCGKSVAPGASCNLDITFSPATQGTFAATVSIADSASSKPQVIEVSGSGTIVTLSPSSLKFGPQKQRTVSPPQHVTLTNTGKIAMTVSKVSVHGDNWTSFDATDNCPSSLGAGASCTITVEYKPLLGSGAQTANVYVTDSGGGSPQIVTLSGTATK
jgi:FG-GAP-like repeat/Abnormal spindle-like microcephaly-assoc'd, ASPM-SPD-2-Hydin